MNVPSNGWSARLYWQWILYNTVAFVVVLTAVGVVSWIGADVLHASWIDRSWVAAAAWLSLRLQRPTSGARRDTRGGGPPGFGRHPGSRLRSGRDRS
jgi:hypothetical protein